MENLGERKGENGKEEPKVGEVESDKKETKDDPRDEGVCIARVVPKQLGDDLEKTMREMFANSTN